MTLAASTVSLSGRISFADVALALCLVAASVVVSRVRGVGLEGDITVATVRSFVQRDVLPFQDEWEAAGELPRSFRDSPATSHKPPATSWCSS